MSRDFRHRGPVTTHYTSATPVHDGVTTDLAGGNFGRPSINNGETRSGITSTAPFQEGILLDARRLPDARPADRVYNGAGDRGDANNTDRGIGAFETSFFNANGAFVTAIATSNAGVLAIVADTLNGYGVFGFYAPAINTRGEVAFSAFLPDFTPTASSRPDPKEGRDHHQQGEARRARGSSAAASPFFQALNNAGEVVFIVDLVDPTRSKASDRDSFASPKKPLAP
jgi:hypothetical protein